jgi:energy-coupling factor transporter ATP-binding protein EcfA2
MLHDLHISDLGVIDDAHLEVTGGLNVLTGETGAGKTMVVDALALLLGERAAPEAVRDGRPAALVEARRPRPQRSRPPASRPTTARWWWPGRCSPRVAAGSRSRAAWPPSAASPS